MWATWADLLYGVHHFERWNQFTGFVDPDIEAIGHFKTRSAMTGRAVVVSSLMENCWPFATESGSAQGALSIGPQPASVAAATPVDPNTVFCRNSRRFKTPPSEVLILRASG